MDYNQFTYYRSNPYSNQGFMPPAAHNNRHKPDFLTEMPMGESPFGKIGKRFYKNTFQKSNIKEQGILESPEKYPYEHRIALQKKYQRNLSTLDIQGASSGTVISQGVRNKIKGREQLIRLQKLNQSNERYQHLELTEQQKKRAIAYQQYLKDQEIAKMIANKEKQNQEKAKQPANQGYKSNQDRNNNYHEKGHEKGPSKPRTPQNNQIGQPRYYQHQNQEPQLPRYHSIDASSSLRNNPEFSPKNYMRRGYGKRTTFDPKYPFLSQSKIEDEMFKADGHYDKQRVNRSQLRKHNPTNLSSDRSIYLAGRNIINN